MRLSIYLGFLLVSVSATSSRAAECPGDRILNGRCIRAEFAEQDCTAAVGSGILRRSCLALARMPAPPQLYRAALSDWAADPNRCESDRNTYALKLATDFPGGRKQLDEAVKSCREVTKNYGKRGVLVTEAEVRSRYEAVRRQIDEITEAAKTVVAHCPKYRNEKNPIVGKPFPPIEDARANSVENYFDGTIYLMVGGSDFLSARYGESETSSSECRSAMVELRRKADRINLTGFAFSGYALNDADTRGVSRGAIFELNGRFFGIPALSQSDLGLAYFRTYSECVELMDEFAIAGYDPKRDRTPCGLGPKVNRNLSKGSIPTNGIPEPRSDPKDKVGQPAMPVY